MGFFKIWLKLLGWLLPIPTIVFITINFAFKHTEYFNQINMTGVIIIFVYITGLLAYVVHKT